jgi:hypothetical protein
MAMDIQRLADKIKAAFEAYNDIDMTTPQIANARVQIPYDIAKAIVEEIGKAKVTVPGAGLAAPNGPVTGTSITGTLT